MTVWRTERRYGDEYGPDEWGEAQPPRRRRPSPRDRFATPMPISPALPPVAAPPPARPPADSRRAGPPGRVDPYDPGTIIEPEILPPGAAVPRPRHGPPPLPARREPDHRSIVELTGPLSGVPAPRATRSRFDWRVTRHAAKALEVIDDQPRFLTTFGWTAAWFAVPFALFAAWSLTFPGDPGTACARPTGNACMSPRSHALEMLMQSMPRVAAALCIALVIAGLVRLGSAAWRPITVGFSAAIIGAGVTTVLYSVLAT